MNIVDCRLGLAFIQIGGRQPFKMDEVTLQGYNYT